MELSFRTVQIIVTVINVLSIAACIWMFSIFSKAKEKSVTFLAIVIMLFSNLVYHLTTISMLWAGDNTSTLEISNLLALYSSLFWSVAMSYLVYKASQSASLPTQDSEPYFNWLVFVCFMSACVWITVLIAGGLANLPRNIVLGILVAAVIVLYIMSLLKMKNPSQRGMTASVKSELKVWGASFVCAAIFLGIGTMIGALLYTNMSMWIVLLMHGITGISSVVIVAVYKFSVETRQSGSSGGAASSSRGAFAGRGYTLM